MLVTTWPELIIGMTWLFLMWLLIMMAGLQVGRSQDPAFHEEGNTRFSSLKAQLTGSRAPLLSYFTCQNKHRDSSDLCREKISPLLDVRSDVCLRGVAFSCWKLSLEIICHIPLNF